MAFQSNVFIQQAAGVQGDRYSDSPWRAQSLILRSVDEANNKIGSSMYTVSIQGTADASSIAAAGSSGTFGFAGLLVNSKVYALRGTTAGTLEPSMVLPNETQAEFATMGHYVVTLPAAANIGDLVVFDNTTGLISTIAPGAPLAAGTSFGFGKVDIFNVAAAGLGVIEMSPTFVIPV